MLVSVLSCVEPAGSVSGTARAFLPVAGKSVLRRQAEFALAMGSERVVVVAQGLSDELVAIQHLVERAGGRFHAITGTRALAGLVSAADDVLLLADGVLPDFALVEAKLTERRGICTFPAEPAIAEGFERIDRERAWAGVLRTGGSDVERLSVLPADSDPASALMRGAVQAGRAIFDIPVEQLAGDRWVLVQDAAQAEALGETLVSQAMQPARWSAPTHALADRLVRAGAGRLLATAGSGNALAIAGILFAAVALALAWSGFPVLAYSGLAFAAISARALQSLASLRGPPAGWFARRREPIVAALLDIALVAVFAWSVPHNGWLFPLAMTLGLVRLGQASANAWLAEFARDRALLAAIFAAAVFAGQIVPVAQAVAVIFLVILLVDSLRSRLTPA